jgi:hypothetical protein
MPGRLVPVSARPGHQLGRTASAADHLAGRAERVTPRAAGSASRQTAGTSTQARMWPRRSSRSATRPPVKKKYPSADATMITTLVRTRSTYRTKISWHDIYNESGREKER